MRKALIERNSYRDSVSLMLLSSQIKKLPGVDEVAVLMGTPANRRRIAAAGFSSDEMERAGPNDLCIGIEAQDEAAVAAALQAIEDFLRGKAGQAAGARPHARPNPKTLSSALKALPGAQIVSISLPGEYAAAEARKALDLGLHVFLFSDNVPIADERSLKELAAERGLLLMGPDCGTALINGCPLGFCNLAPAGPVGIVAASGTGAQQVMSLLANAGIGVSHVIGTGGRDLSAEIGGLACATGLQALAQDPRTEVIVLISKPPAPELEAQIIALAQAVKKPVVLCLIGRSSREQAGENLFIAENLAHAAQIAGALVRKEAPPTWLPAETLFERYAEPLTRALDAFSPEQKYVRGLFSGGTLADEAAAILSGHLPAVRAGSGFGAVLPVEDWDNSQGNTILDLGEDRFTQGRPHPMIDPGIRSERILQESADPAVAVLLMDVILGLNAEENPALSLTPAIAAARRRAAAAGRSLAFVLHICGTAADPQDLAAQTRLFEAAGCLVFPSNAEAAMAAALLCGGFQENHA